MIVIKYRSQVSKIATYPVNYVTKEIMKIYVVAKIFH